MDLMEIAANLFKQHLGENAEGLDINRIQDALSSLLDTSNGDLDLSSLLSKVQSGGFTQLATSWLSNGNNENMSAMQVGDVFNSSDLESFANKLNLDTETAKRGLSDMIPELIDKQSDGGALNSTISNVLGGFLRR